MGKRNLTVQLNDDVIHRAKITAAKRGTSVSGLVTQQLERLADADERYEDAQRRAQRAQPDRTPRRQTMAPRRTSPTVTKPPTE